MAKYRVTIEFTTRLSREIEANSAEDAEQYGFQAATVRKPTVRVRQRHDAPKK
jgi:hypothetical protein